MKRLLLALGTCLPLLAGAANLETVVAPFALPAGATYSANDWSVTNTIQGIQWQHKGLKETPTAPFTRLGNLNLDKLAKASVFYSGARTMVTQLDVSVSGNDDKMVETENFGKALRVQFSAATKIRQLRGACKDDGAMSGSSVYEVTLPAKKPVFLMMSVDSGGSSPNSRTTSFQFSLEPEKRWAC
jgi:hypothetical protein